MPVVGNALARRHLYGILAEDTVALQWRSKQPAVAQPLKVEYWSRIRSWVVQNSQILIVIQLNSTQVYYNFVVGRPNSTINHNTWESKSVISANCFNFNSLWLYTLGRWYYWKRFHNKLVAFLRHLLANDTFVRLHYSHLHKNNEARFTSPVVRSLNNGISAETTLVSLPATALKATFIHFMNHCSIGYVTQGNKQYHTTKQTARPLRDIHIGNSGGDKHGFAC